MATRRKQSTTKKSLLIKRERRNVGRALSGGNTFLDSVIENIPHMIFVKDAKELRFIRFNKAGEDLLGYSKKSMIGKNDYDFFPKPEADFFTRKDREVLENGRLFDIPEEPIHTRYHGIRILHTKKIPIIDEKGKPSYLLGISEDITERLNLQKEIAAISDREQKRIGQDLHDGLGQHLTGVAFLIKGLSQQLAMKRLPEAHEAEKIAELVNRAISTTRNLARVLNPIDLESGSLDTALAQLATSTQRLFNIQCLFEYDMPFVLDSSEAVHLFRIAQEAVDNAVKHGRATQIRILCETSNGSIQLMVEDNGVGLAKGFERRHGMGISNMTYRAKSLGGSLKVARGRSRGTVVTCLIPER